MGKGQGKNISKAKVKKTDRQKFLEMMDSYVPWKDWIILIDPYYYQQGRRGRKELSPRSHASDISATGLVLHL